MQYLPDNDMLFDSNSYRMLNPSPTPSSEMRDVCIRRCPLKDIRADLVENARRGGTAMVESLSQGLWGGYG